MSKDLEKFQQQQKHLIESLDSYYDKWSNSDFSQVIDRLSAVAKNLIEENQKIKCIIGKCIDQESKKRPSIIDLFNEFWLELTEKNKLVIIFYMLEKIYLNHDNISNICNYH